jgi:two-component system, LytTR family, response regulator
VASKIYLSGEEGYTKIFIKDKRQLFISSILGDVEELLSAELFLRIHHSTVVTVTCIIPFYEQKAAMWCSKATTTFL